MVNFYRLRESLALFCAHDDSQCIQPTGNLNFKHCQDSSLSRSALILPSVAMWFFTAVLLAVGVVVLAVWKRRQSLALREFSDQIHRLSPDPGAARTLPP